MRAMTGHKLEDTETAYPSGNRNSNQHHISERTPEIIATTEALQDTGMVILFFSLISPAWKTDGSWRVKAEY